jgi:surface polysaccharide O-acyltransferase-like enzyme
MAEKINGRVAYADLLRVFASFAVIVCHLASRQISVVAVGSQSWQIFNLYNALVRWCVPVFVMLSGMFMLDPKKGLPLPKLLFHNCLRIVVCLMFWGGVYAVTGYCIDGGRFTWQGLWNAILNALRGDTRYHLWFLYMILGLYLITPILRAFCRGASRGDFHWFFLIAFLFASVIPTAFQLWPRADIMPVLKLWYERLDIQLVMGYVGYYVAGWYLREYTLSRIAEALIYVFGIIGATITVWGTSVLSHSAGRLVETLFSFFSPNVVCFSIAIVVLFRYVLGVSEERSRRQRLSGVAQVAFGIYLIHDLFLTLMNFLGVSVLSFAPVASVPLLAMAVFLCSFAVAWLIHWLPFIGRWLT